MLDQIKAIHKTCDSTSKILKNLQKLTGFQDENEVFVLLRACLKALRNRLEPHEASHLASQLPALLRGFYYEGYSYTQVPHPLSDASTAEEFLDDVRFHLQGYDQFDLDEVVPHAMKVILDSIDQGEAIQVLHQLPKEIQVLCPE